MYTRPASGKRKLDRARRPGLEEDDAMIIRRLAPCTALVLAAVPLRASAQLLDILTGPKALIEAAVEDRSLGDIAKDKEISVKVAGVMADIGTLQASHAI
jgi:hypothetical protein